MTANRESPGEPASDHAADDLAGRLGTDIAAIERELTEIDMLVAQASTEVTRHEQKRAAAADKLANATNLPPEDLAALNAQLLTLTKRTAVMETQVDVLEGKRKTLVRFRDALRELGETYGGVQPSPADAEHQMLTAGAASGGGDAGGAPGGGSGPSPMSRIVLNAQEDLRREIARAMHDGPAQSLTNIVLQAQIVDHLLGRDPDRARAEVRQLVSMVQQTLEATKTFIFEVRPMVLDDLGLVPTLRRSARERGRRAGVPIEFDSIGQDRRIDVDLESSLFRIIDESLAGYLSGRPDRLSVRLDWSDDVVEARIAALRDATQAITEADREVAEVMKAAEGQKDLPPALESMMTDRRRRADEQAAAAREAAIVALPGATWREIQQRATTTGVTAELADGGGTLLLRAELGSGGDAAPSA